MAVENKYEKYIEYVAVLRLFGYKEIAEFENKDEASLRKSYKTIDDWLIEKLEVTGKELKYIKEKTQKEKDEIDKLFKNQYTKDRKIGFKTFEEFYKWHKEQKNKCFYCGVTAETLQSLFESKKLSSTKFNATLHIERLKPKEPYSPENTKLACSLCNNAKSDLISQKNYEKYFAEAMTNFLKDLDSGKIENKID